MRNLGHWGLLLTWGTVTGCTFSDVLGQGVHESHGSRAGGGSAGRADAGATSSTVAGSTPGALTSAGAPGDTLGGVSAGSAQLGGNAGTSPLSGGTGSVEQGGNAGTSALGGGAGSVEQGGSTEQGGSAGSVQLGGSAGRGESAGQGGSAGTSPQGGSAGSAELGGNAGSGDQGGGPAGGQGGNTGGLGGTAGTAAQAGSGGSQPPLGECISGAVEQQACGLGQAGVRVRTCQAGVWSYGACSAKAAKQVVAGAYHTCLLLEDGAVSCFGSNELGQLDAPAGVKFVQLTASSNRTCGVSSTHEVLCWGQGGTTLPADSYFSVELSGLSCIHGLNSARQAIFGNCQIPSVPGPWLSYRGGTSWFAGIDQDGSVLIKGYSTTDIRLVPKTGRYIDAVMYAALRDDGSVDYAPISGASKLPGSKYRGLTSYSASGAGTLCGVNFSGQLECADELNRPFPIGDLAPSVGFGTYHTCALTTVGDVVCAARYPALPLPEQQGFVQLYAGDGSICGRRANGSFACWGQLVLEIQPSTPLVDFAVGARTACGLDSDGRAMCWGSGAFFVNAVPQNERYSDIDVAATFACGVLKDSAWLSCWGDPEMSQATAAKYWTGAGSEDAPLTSVDTSHYRYFCAKGKRGLRCGYTYSGLKAVDPPVPELSVYRTGKENMCGLSLTGELVCRGYWHIENEISSSERFVSLGMSSGVCGLRADGSSACFGGDAAATHRVPPDERFVQVELADEIACGLRGDGSVRCWGNYDFGQHLPR